jgi:hypothetical protein
MAETVLPVPALAEHDFARPKSATADAVERRPVSPNLLGKAALRIGSHQADSDLGLALAALGLIVAGMRRVPHPVGLPDLAAVAALLPPERRSHAAAILETARGIVAWCATQEDAALAAAPVAGNA